jgi:hypothetical protein
MSNFDKQRIAAVRKLELGYTFADGDWHAPPGMGAPAPTSVQADAMHALLVQRADALEGCPEGSEEERELAAITDAKRRTPPSHSASIDRNCARRVGVKVATCCGQIYAIAIRPNSGSSISSSSKWRLLLRLSKTISRCAPSITNGTSN